MNDLGIVYKIGNNDGIVNLLIDGKVHKFYFTNLKEHEFGALKPIGRHSIEEMYIKLGNKYKMTLVEV